MEDLATAMAGHIMEDMDRITTDMDLGHRIITAHPIIIIIITDTAMGQGPLKPEVPKTTTTTTTTATAAAAATATTIAYALKRTSQKERNNNAGQKENA
ncbi:hypothetical protein AWZ03_012176 [Drosophila navojoa]|uniref:Uncharacterized protein n=1 Tax=Drosophila navojoa TaxID=7232 RepID=A0A484AYH0_DRONA|nr:hypothetical protein AWZ03_012176 [Drosophila navojoa]